MLERIPGRTSQWLGASPWRIHAMVAVGVLLGSEALLAQAQLSDAVKSFVRVDAPLVALEHVRVIDGTGAPPAEDQTVVIQNGRIRALGPSASTAVPEGAKA